MAGANVLPCKRSVDRAGDTWHGRLLEGVEGTGRYGAALARHLTKNDVQVLEVARPNRQVRRRFGKTDVIDAIAAGRAVLSDEATGAPKGQDGRVEPLRTLKAVQRSGNKARPLGRTVLLATCADFPIKPDDGGGRRRLGWLAAVVLTVDAMLANHPDRVRPVEKPPSAALPSRGVLALAPMRADDLAVFAVAAIRHDPAPGWSSLALTHRQQSGAVVR